MNTKRRAPKERLEGLLYLSEKSEMSEKRKKLIDRQMVSCSDISFLKSEVSEKTGAGLPHWRPLFRLLKTQCRKKSDSKTQLKQWFSLSFPTFPTFRHFPEDPPDFISQPTAIHEKVKT